MAEQNPCNNCFRNSYYIGSYPLYINNNNNNTNSSNTNINYNYNKLQDNNNANMIYINNKQLNNNKDLINNNLFIKKDYMHQNNKVVIGSNNMFVNNMNMPIENSKYYKYARDNNNNYNINDYNYICNMNNRDNYRFINNNNIDYKLGNINLNYNNNNNNNNNNNYNNCNMNSNRHLYNIEKNPNNKYYQVFQTNNDNTFDNINFPCNTYNISISNNNINNKTSINNPNTINYKNFNSNYNNFNCYINQEENKFKISNKNHFNTKDIDNLNINKNIDMLINNTNEETVFDSLSNLKTNIINTNFDNININDNKEIIDKLNIYLKETNNSNLKNIIKFIISCIKDKNTKNNCNLIKQTTKSISYFTNNNYNNAYKTRIIQSLFFLIVKPLITTLIKEPIGLMFFKKFILCLQPNQIGYIWKECIYLNILNLSTNKYSNIAIQDFMNLSNKAKERKLILNKFYPHFNKLCFNRYGIHVVKKIISTFDFTVLRKKIPVFIIDNFYNLVNNPNGVCTIIEYIKSIDKTTRYYLKLINFKSLKIVYSKKNNNICNSCFLQLKIDYKKNIDSNCSNSNCPFFIIKELKSNEQVLLKIAQENLSDIIKNKYSIYVLIALFKYLNFDKCKNILNLIMENIVQLSVKEEYVKFFNFITNFSKKKKVRLNIIFNYTITI